MKSPKEAFKLEKEWFESDAIITYDFCDFAGKQTNRQTGMTDIQALNKLLEKKNRYLRFRNCIDIEADFSLMRDFLTKLHKGEASFQIDPSNLNIVEGFRGGLHYHGDAQKVCGCTNANEFFEHEKDYYKHLNDTVRYIMTNNFSMDGVIKSNQTKLEFSKVRDKRFNFKEHRVT